VEYKLLPENWLRVRVRSAGPTKKLPVASLAFGSKAKEISSSSLLRLHDHQHTGIPSAVASASGACSDTIPGLLNCLTIRVQVREIYRMYLDLGSPQRILAEIEQRGWRLKAFTTRKGRSSGNAPFTRTSLHNLLTNPVYTGRVRHYGTTYPGEHKSIIGDRIWTEVQKRLNRDDRRGRHHIQDPCGALLSWRNQIRSWLVLPTPYGQNTHLTTSGAYAGCSECKKPNRCAYWLM